MPNNISRYDAGSEIRAIHARLSRIENSPQVGHQSILDGSLNILDKLGRTLMVLGNQPDGSVGLSMYDPVTGAQQVALGQQGASGVLGLGVRNPGTGILQILTGASTATVTATQSTSSTTYIAVPTSPQVVIPVGPSGQALISIGAFIGVGGDGDEGFVKLVIDGDLATAVEGIGLSSGIAGGGVASSASRTTVVTGLAVGNHTFSLAYKSATGVHGISASDMWITASPY